MNIKGAFTLVLFLAFAQSTYCQKKVGHIVMGMIGYELTDTLSSSKATADFMVSMMSEEMVYDVYYNETMYCEVRKNEKGEIDERSVFDASNNVLIEYLYTSDGNYSVVDSLGEEMKKVPKTSKEDSIKLTKLIRLDPSHKSDTLIFGKHCEKVVVMQPEDLNSISMITYTAGEIPYISSAMGDMSKMMPGFPMLLSMYVQGVIIHAGAMSHEVIPDSHGYLNTSLEGYEPLSRKKFDVKKKSSENPMGNPLGN